MKPLISVIMPVYNSEKFLRESIDSILSQTFENFELLVVYDKSSDSTLEILKDFENRDKRVRILLNQGPRGIAPALNFGLDQAQGTYIARADADDINRADRFSVQLDFLNKNPEIVLIGGGYAPFKDGKTRTEIFHPRSSMELAWRFIFDTFLCHPSVLFRKDILEDTGNYPAVVAEDYAFFSRVIQTHPIANLNRILLDYREHDNNMSVTKYKEVRACVQKTSEENFRRIFGNLDGYETLHRFQFGQKISIKEYFVVFALVKKFITVIRKKYPAAVIARETPLFIFMLGFRTLGNFITKVVRFIYHRLKF